jgi:hypothetical protein
VSLVPVELKGQRGKDEFQLVVPLSDEEGVGKAEDEDEPKRRSRPL